MESSEKTEKTRRKEGPFLLAIFALALFFRSAGLFHGLDGHISFHPDTLKQVQATRNFLEGQVLWYTGSLAYDGYPYGLNHVDAALTRIIWPVWRGLTAFLDPSSDLPVIPELDHLFVLCRLYRVAFGMGCLLLLNTMLRRRGVSTSSRYLWLILAATAPLLSTVTHSASGDVGTDLFVLASLACLMPVVDRVRLRYFIACGGCLGMAFACKYNALLAGAGPGLFWLLLPLTTRERIQTACMAALGFFAGVVLLTPAFLIRPEKTFRLIRDNFIYIRNFGVEAEFLELPFFQQVHFSLNANLPQLYHAFGWLLALFVFGLIGLGIRCFKRKRPSPGLAWDLSLLVMVSVALTLSILGKPAAQPFHFSFLFCPLLLGTAGAWNRAPLTTIRAILWMGCLMILGLQISLQTHEVAMWTRESTLELSRRVPERLLHPAENPDRQSTLGWFEVEGPSLSVFRNGGRPLRLAQAEAWENTPMAALPATPFSFSPDWVFLDHPAFPRDDRLIQLQAHTAWEKTVIDLSESTEIPFRVQAGERPSTVTLIWNGHTRQIPLRPRQTVTLQLPAERGTPFERNRRSGIRHRLKLTCRGSDVLIRIGPEPVSAEDPATTEKLTRARFLSGNTWIPSRLRHAILLNSVHLPPAQYRLRLNHPPEIPLPDLVVEPAQLPHPQLRQRIPLRREGEEAVAEVSLPSPALFSKLTLEYPERHPYGITWHLDAVDVLSVSEQPDTVPPAPPFLPQVNFKKGQVALGNIKILDASGDELTLTLRADLRLEDQQDLHRWVVFVHVLDENGHQVAAKDLRLEEIPDRDSPRHLNWTLQNLSLSPGTYQVGIGLYDPATELRFRPDLIQANYLPDLRAGTATFTVLP